jgi:hypothetical protein
MDERPPFPCTLFGRSCAFIDEKRQNRRNQSYDLESQRASTAKTPRSPRIGEHEMKKPILSNSILGSILGATMVCLLSVFPFPAFAQEDEQNAKNLYLARARNPKRGRPGVKVTIELKRNGVTQKVPMNYSFRGGDKVKFHFETNFNAYVKVINIGSSGALQLLYPYPGATEFVARTKDYAIPQGDRWFEFVNNPGTEQLTFVFSSRPLAGGDQQEPLADLNSLSLEIGKDFKLVQDTQGSENSAYGVVPARIARKPIGIRINLSHQ